MTRKEFVHLSARISARLTNRSGGGGLRCHSSSGGVPPTDVVRYNVWEGGQLFKDQTRAALEQWRHKKYHVLLDYVANLIKFNIPDEPKPTINFGSATVAQKTLLEMLRQMAIYSGEMFTPKLFEARTGFSFQSRHFLAKRICYLRKLIEDTGITQLIVEQSAGSYAAKTGRAYCANGVLLWRVVDYGVDPS